MERGGSERSVSALRRRLFVFTRAGKQTYEFRIRSNLKAIFFNRTAECLSVQKPTDEIASDLLTPIRPGHPIAGHRPNPVEN